MATERKKQQDRERMQRKRQEQNKRIEELEMALSLCHETMHETIAVLSFNDSKKVADAMALAKKALWDGTMTFPKSYSPQPNGYLEDKDHPDDGPDRRGMGDW